MKTLQMFLFPAFSLTGPLIFATTSSGLLVAIGLQCVTRRPLPRLWERCRKALGYGGTLGVAVCLFILMAFDDTGRPKLSPGELANTALLGFATAGLVAAGAQYLLALLSDRWMGPPDRLGKDSQPRHLRSAPVTARFSAHPAPPISVRRVPRRQASHVAGHGGNAGAPPRFRWGTGGAGPSQSMLHFARTSALLVKIS